MLLAQRGKHAFSLYGHQSISDLEEIIDYAQEIGMDIITHAELYDLIKDYEPLVIT